MQAIYLPKSCKAAYLAAAAELVVVVLSVAVPEAEAREAAWSAWSCLMRRL